MRTWWIGLGAAALLANCDAQIADYCSKGTIECTPAADAGSDGAAMDGSRADGGDGGDGGDAGATCDPSPAASACGVNEAHGVFVAPAATGGNDATGSGTRTSPFGSIGHGLDVAKSSGKNVYVCAGAYAESLVIGSSRDGADVYGGLDCVSWSYATANRVRVAPAQTGYALEVASLATGTTLEDLEFDALSASPAHPGESGVAAFVHGSQNVAMHRVTLVAGNGSNGAAGTSAGPPGPSNWDTADGGLNGASATSSAPGTAESCMCGIDASHGSMGGQGGSPTQVSVAGTPSYGSDAGTGTAGVNGASCNMLGGGTDGVSAPALSQDVGNASWGSPSSTGWSPSTGTNGSIGQTGQGGGGGGDGPNLMGFGGGGACGGCGGNGGRGGGGGGASIALLGEQSNVTLSSCTLIAAGGGAGGTGGTGEAGQVGGLGGVQATGGCPGGGGGGGGGGNGGQGGPGGVSVGIAFTGTAPTVDGSVVMSQATLGGVTVAAAKASGGAAGMGGAAANFRASAGANGAPGVAGASQAVLGL